MSEFISLPLQALEQKLQSWANQQRRDTLVSIILVRYLRAHHSNDLGSLPHAVITMLENHSVEYRDLLARLHSRDRAAFRGILQSMLNPRTNLQIASIARRLLVDEYYSTVESQAQEHDFFAKYGVSFTPAETSRWALLKEEEAARRFFLRLLGFARHREARVQEDVVVYRGRRSGVPSPVIDSDDDLDSDGGVFLR